MNTTKYRLGSLANFEIKIRAYMLIYEIYMSLEKYLGFLRYNSIISMHDLYCVSIMVNVIIHCSGKAKISLTKAGQLTFLHYNNYSHAHS